MAFDHYCHLRYDVLKPSGPIDRAVPPSDDLRLGATLEWLLAGLPQMPGRAIAQAVSKKVGLRLTGAGGGEWTISTTKPDVQITVTDGIAADVAATITWLTTDLVLWATRRKPWRAAQVTVDGDNLYASIVLDAIHLF